ncbi:MAG: hypothetical protein M1835_000216 [Candelina submexicana]|nr:MAG: hypothetical protein M1835_000216 [Candelina submexicana]
MAITRLQTGAIKKKGRGARKVIDDSDDETYGESTKKTTPKKATPKKPVKRESPKGTETTTSDYFASNGKSKPSRSALVKSKAPAAKPAATEVTPKASPAKAAAKASARSTKARDITPTKPATNGRTSTRKKPVTSYVEHKDDDDAAYLDHDDDAGDDVFNADFKKTGNGLGDEYQEDDDDDDDEVLKPTRKSTSRGKQASLVKDEDEAVPEDQDVDMKDINANNDFVVPDEDEEIVVDKPAKGRKAPSRSAGKKRKSVELDQESEEDFEPVAKKAKAAKQSPAKKPAAKKTRTPAKKEEAVESKEIQDIFDHIPTVRPPTPPAPSGETKKFSFRDAAQHAQRVAPPPGSGSKERPDGAENCLTGLTFVFTGILEDLGREEGQELVKRYGGKVTTTPSSKTSYVVLGSDAGPRKLEVIAKNHLKTINEDGLFELIRRLPANGGSGIAAEKNEEKKRKEEQKIKEMAAEMEKEDRRTGGAGGAGTGAAGKSIGDNSNSTVDSRLWTVKYAPKTARDICGNKGQVEKLQAWLRNWGNSAKFQFKKAGKDGTGVFRAVCIHGPPGIGKTTAAHLAATVEGYDIVESNASDTRSKKLVESGLRGVLDTTSLYGYFAGDGKKVEAGKKKLVLIMDEVDGMSAGDRGGVGALAAVCKKTNIPMILICNERRQPKMKPFDYVVYDLPFRRPTTQEIRSRIGTICFREKLNIPAPVMNALIEGTHADIRQIINMVSTAKLDQEAMDYDKGKSMSKAWEKHVVLKPWDIASKLLGGGLFAQSSKATLNEKIELYFNDHEFSYLMLQENYLGTNPMLSTSYSGNEKNLKQLELVDKAAESISDGDLVDRMIHGPQQQWSLMPTHAVFSTVRPASFVSGSMAGHQTRFTSWLGNNSKLGKLTRFIKEIQGHMRLRASGDRHEIRQQYLPALWYQLIKKLDIEGKEAVEDVIQLMDSYFLTKDDWDAILELGLGPMDSERIKLESSTKANFTRTYNSQSHPLPFMKASNIVAPKKLAREKPDIDEAFDESDEGEEVAAEEDGKEDDEEELDLKKDKYVKVPKKKPAAAKKAAPKKGAGKKGKPQEESEDEELDDESEEDVKPRKGKGATKGKAPAGKGRGRK